MRTENSAVKGLENIIAGTEATLKPLIVLMMVAGLGHIFLG